MSRSLRVRFAIVAGLAGFMVGSVPGLIIAFAAYMTFPTLPDWIAFVIIWPLGMGFGIWVAIKVALKVAREPMKGSLQHRSLQTTDDPDRGR